MYWHGDTLKTTVTIACLIGHMVRMKCTIVGTTLQDLFGANAAKNTLVQVMSAEKCMIKKGTIRRGAPTKVNPKNLAIIIV